jgi:hypothetical protein
MLEVGRVEVGSVSEPLEGVSEEVLGPELVDVGILDGSILEVVFSSETLAEVERA